VSFEERRSLPFRSRRASAVAPWQTVCGLVALFSVTAAPLPACVGDCDADGFVFVNELVVGVGLVLDRGSPSSCASLDRDRDGAVGIDELLEAVRNSARGCPAITPSPTPTATPGPIAETRCSPAPGTGVSFDPNEPFCELLSSYRFFLGNGSTQEPNDGLLPYDLNTALFSDYALKHRFVWMPAGTAATYHPLASFSFPVGTVIIKTFAYPLSFQEPQLGERLLETRLIVRRAGGWEPITYLWNEEQTEARRRVIGATLPVSWVDEEGATRRISYHVPNTNQCGECHEERSGQLGPLGPKARNLNKDYPYADGVANQLARWTAVGYLTGAPDPTLAPRAAAFDDPDTGTLDERARAYLDVNCGNCHNPSGFGRTSGMYLTIDENDPTRLGICKSPVAAGQGSGGRRVGIFPGRPDDSILVYRMESTAPGIAMPELGRQTVHDEALEVIRAWITSLPGSCDLR
jgi:uncharacterized repeat protein (TIGR03806 family)